jgi:hypothetical protein
MLMNKRETSAAVMYRARSDRGGRYEVGIGVEIGVGVEIDEWAIVIVEKVRGRERMDGYVVGLEWRPWREAEVGDEGKLDAVMVDE